MSRANLDRTLPPADRDDAPRFDGFEQGVSSTLGLDLEIRQLLESAHEIGMAVLALKEAHKRHGTDEMKDALDRIKRVPDPKAIARHVLRQLEG